MMTGNNTWAQVSVQSSVLFHGFENSRSAQVGGPKTNCLDVTQFIHVEPVYTSEKKVADGESRFGGFSH